MKQAGAAPRCVAALRYLSGRPPPLLTFAFPMMALFDTTSRAVGGRLGPRGRASRESHPSEDLSELPPLRDPATRWFPNVMDYSDLKQGCGWTGVPLCPFPVMAAPGAARFLQAAVTRSYRTGLYARPIMIIRWDLLIMSVYHGAAPESALALRAGKGDVTDE